MKGTGRGLCIIDDLVDRCKTAERFSQGGRILFVWDSESRFVKPITGR
jgi:hypothetical protein